MKVMKFETKEIAYQQFVLTRLIQLMRCLAFFIMVLHETFQLFLVDFVCIEFGCLISLIKWTLFTVNDKSHSSTCVIIC